MKADDVENERLASLRSGLALLLRDLHAQLADAPDSLCERDRSIAEIDEAFRHWLSVHEILGGPADVDLDPIALQPVVEWAIASCSTRDQRRIDYHCIDPVYVLGDRTRLAIAIATLLQVTLSASPVQSTLAVRLTDSPQRATLTIHVPAGGRRDAVGLYFARKIVAAHQGLIASVELRDAVLWCVELPLHDARTMATSAPLVLLVDDNISQATALTEMLRADGIVTKVATSGPEALVRLANVRPDLLVVDMQLRGMNGADVIMRAREHAPDLPAVIVSGYPVDHPLIARTMTLPACRYLGKPIHVDALVSLARAARRAAYRP
jgi:CheY-like chemotaxis protein